MAFSAPQAPPPSLQDIPNSVLGNGETPGLKPPLGPPLQVSSSSCSSLCRETAPPSQGLPGHAASEVAQARQLAHLQALQGRIGAVAEVIPDSDLFLQNLEGRHRKLCQSQILEGTQGVGVLGWETPQGVRPPRVAAWRQAVAHPL